MKARFPERSERLRDYFNRFKIKNIDAASKLGIKPAFISQLLNKHATVTADVAVRIGRIYPELNISWLLDGEGQMVKSMERLADTVREPDASYTSDPLSALRRELDEMKARQVALEERVARLEGGEDE